jgi:CIC family chloride channel protein
MRLKRESIYTLKLVRRGINIFQGREKNILKSMFVKEIMGKDVELVSEDTPISKLVELATNTKHSCFYVRDESDNLIGVIDEISLRQALASSQYLKHIFIAEDITNLHVATVRENDSLDSVMSRFAHENLDELPVVSHFDQRKVIGSIMLNDVVAAYNSAIIKREHDEVKAIF